MKLTLEQLKSMIREQVEEVKASRFPPDARTLTLATQRRPAVHEGEQQEEAAEALEVIKDLEAAMIRIEVLGLSEVDSLLVHNNIKSIRKVLQRVVEQEIAD